MDPFRPKAQGTKTVIKQQVGGLMLEMTKSLVAEAFVDLENIFLTWEADPCCLAFTPLTLQRRRQFVRAIDCRLAPWRRSLEIDAEERAFPDPAYLMLDNWLWYPSLSCSQSSVQHLCMCCVDKLLIVWSKDCGSLELNQLVSIFFVLDSWAKDSIW